MNRYESRRVRTDHLQSAREVFRVPVVLGAIGAVATIGEALFVHHTPSGWASTMVVLLLVSGVQSMILGVLGEYVGRTFLSANGKPQGTVRSIQRNRDAA